MFRSRLGQELSKTVRRQRDLLFSFTMLLMLIFNNRKLYKAYIYPLIGLSPVLRRTMISGRTLSAARAVYYVMNVMANKDVVNNTTKVNHRPLTNSLVDLSLDHSKGTPQHKTVLLHSMTSCKFPADQFLEPFVANCNYPAGLFTWPSNITSDVRITKELPVYATLHNQFGSSIDSTIATLDSMSGNFPHQSQSNQDFWVKVKSAVTFKDVSFRHTYHDEKSGMDMFRHGTRGSIGLLTYDSKGNNVQVTSKPITPYDFIEYNKKRYNGITGALEIDGLEDVFRSQINEYTMRIDYIKSLNQTNHKSIFDSHSDIQEYLWNNFQRHPAYNRSTSFIFTTTMDYSQATGKQQAFEVRFGSQLQDKTYDLTNQAHRREIFNVALTSYRAEVDPKIVDKLYYYHQNAGIILNSHFLQTIKTLMHNGLS